MNLQSDWEGTWTHKVLTPLIVVHSLGFATAAVQPILCFGGRELDKIAPSRTSQLRKPNSRQYLYTYHVHTMVCFDSGSSSLQLLERPNTSGQIRAKVFLFRMLNAHPAKQLSRKSRFLLVFETLKSFAFFLKSSKILAIACHSQHN